MSTALNIPQTMVVTLSVAGRWDTAPSAIDGWCGDFTQILDMTDTQDRTWSDDVTAEDGTVTIGPTHQAFLDTATSLLTQAITLATDRIEPYTSATYLADDDSLLTSLADRNLFGGQAVNTMMAAKAQAIDTNGYWIAANTVPSIIVGNVNPIVLPSPVTAASVVAFIDTQLTMIMDAIEVQLDLSGKGLGIEPTGYLTPRFTSNLQLQKLFPTSSS